MTLTPVAERFAVKLSLPVLRVRSVAAGIRTPNLPYARRTRYPTKPPRRYCSRSDYDINHIDYLAVNVVGLLAFP